MIKVLLPPPSAIDESVTQFCLGISSEKPVYVSVNPAPNGVVSHCFDNVANRISTHRGTPAYGWAIWHWPGVYFEAEHHGIWRSPPGELIDVTPGLTGAKRILFLPDQSAVYDASSFRSNVLVAIDGNESAAEFVSLASTYSSIVDRYRAPGVTQPRLSLQDNILVLAIQVRMGLLHDQLLAKYPPTE